MARKSYLEMMAEIEAELAKQNKKKTPRVMPMQTVNLQQQSRALTNYAGVKSTNKKATTTTKKKKKEEEERTWFNKGAFSDGYDFGDVTKTLLGTSNDISQSLYEGILGIAEKTVDTGATLVGGGSSLLGFDNFADRTKKFVEKDLINEEELAHLITSTTSPQGWADTLLNGSYKDKNYKTNYDKNSVLGEKTDSLVQSGGQLLGTIGLQMVGVPWQATTGATAFGSEAENAFKNDATYGEAILSSAISAGFEVGTEYISGGVKLKGTGATLDTLTGDLTGKISNVVLKNLTNWGIDIAGEGVEEVLSSFGQRLGQALTYEKEATLKELATDEKAREEYVKQLGDKLFGEEARAEYGESFIGGAVLGGAGGASSAYTATKAGVGSKLTTQQVQEAKELATTRIAEIEATGEKLTKKQKEAIEEQAKTEIQYKNANIPIQEQETVEAEKIEAPQAEINDFSEQEQQVTLPEVENASMPVLEAIEAEQQNTEVENVQNVSESEQNVQNATESAEAKQKQFEIIEKSNPAEDDIHTWIRSVDDIKTYQEALQEEYDGEVQDLTPDFKKADLEKALETGKITVYSSKPIENGNFVTPSKMEAQSYAGSGQVYSKEVDLTDVAWVDTLQGQYAKAEEATQEQDQTYYHGTRGDFDTFDNSKIGQNYDGEWSSLGKGFYFTNNYDSAKEFGEASTNDGEVTVKEAKLDIKNPYYVDDFANNNAETIEEIKEKYELGDIANGYQLIDELKSKGHDTTEVLKQYGYDGVVAQDEVMVFDASQIKMNEAQKQQAKPKKPTGTPTQEEIDNLLDIQKNKSGSEYANAFFDLRDKYGEAGLYKALNKAYAKAKNPTQEVQEQVQEAIKPLQEQISKLTDLIENATPTSQVEVEQQGQEAFENITDEYATENDIDTTPDYTDIQEDTTEVKSPFEDRDIKEVGNRKVKAYMYENPEVKPFFQQEAEYMLNDLKNTVKGERIYNPELAYQEGIADQNGAFGWVGIARQTTEDISYLKDTFGYSYAQIEEGLNKIIKDDGLENNAVSKRIEFMLDERLRNGYADVSGMPIPANQDYINLLEEKQISEYHSNRFKDMTDEELLQMLQEPNTDTLIEETTPDIPTVENVAETAVEEEIPVQEEYEAIEPEDIAEEMLYGGKMLRVKEPTTLNKDIAPSTVDWNSVEPTTRGQQQTLEGFEQKQDERVAQVLDEAPTKKNRDKKLKTIATVNLLDKGYYISKLARQTGNRQLDALYDNTLLSNAQAQEVIGEGRYSFNEETKAYEKVGDGIYDIYTAIKATGKTQDFNEYMYHRLNFDRMTLENRFRESNKPVFGETVDALQSQLKYTELEADNPEFIEFANKIYNYESGEYSDLSTLVDSGILSQEQADYYKKKYPNYVPIIRDIDTGMLEGHLFGKKINTKNPVKAAVGGSQDIIPLQDAMAIKTMLVQRSANLNKLGLELMKTLGTEVTSQEVSVDKVVEDLSNGKDLIQAGTNGKAPTMTVYDNGVKKTFEITNEIYEALKRDPNSNLNMTIKPLNAYSNWKRNVLTQYNPFFMVTNMIKDAQDVLINSQHPAQTYKSIPEAIAQLNNKGYWYREMQAQGLFQDTYYDNQGGFDTSKKGLSKITEFYPLRKIGEINDFIERVPRMAEYIASRKAGRSVEVSSLDASRVTTNFKAGGDVTKFLNRNGFTFLNASVQGAMQNVRNFQEANANGLKGWAALATKFTLAALPAVILNGLIWDDDEEYEELSEYVKDNYYIIGKYGDGQFIRIPKGRATAVIQKGLQEMTDLVTGNDEADLGSFLDLVVNNLAPSNPLENNILTPFLDAKLLNKEDPGRTWYGDDLVPSRLQDKPAAEQYDETTDEFSKWLGELTGLSPYKINYLIDQNTGVIGDILLPMGTAESKTKTDIPIISSIEDKFTADVVFDNKNSTDFYSVKDKLTTNSNSENATDEDVLKTKYMNAIQSEMNDLYTEIRDTQNSSMDKTTKYAKVRELRKQINELAKTALDNYEDGTVKTNYAEIAGTSFTKNNDGEWEKVDDKEAGELYDLGMTASDKDEYFTTKNYISDIVKEYKGDKANITLDENSEDYKDAIEELSDDKKAGIIDKILNTHLDNEQKAYLYGKYYSSEKTLKKITDSGISFNDYLYFAKDTLELDTTEKKVEYLYNANLEDRAKTVIYETSVLSGFDNEEKYKDYKTAKAAEIDINAWLSYKKQPFKADKDKNGDSISGSKKRKVINYINSLDLSVPQKAIMIRTEYTSENAYNYDIVSYVDKLDTTYDTKVAILENIGFTIDSNGNVSW